LVRPYPTLLYEERGVCLHTGVNEGRQGTRGAHRIYTVAVFVVLASLDNTAIGLMPPLYGVMSDDLGVGEGSLGLVTAGIFLFTAVTAVVWGYLGDRFNRKVVLLAGTAVWTAGIGATGLTSSYAVVVASQLVAAVGLGAIASVGFSVVSDMVSPRRRGLALGVWGLSQGLGTVAGTILGGVLGAEDWHRPFRLLALVGLGTVVAYLFAYDTPRGASEPELASLFDEGGEYEHRIQPSDLRHLADRRTNVWLVLQGFTAQFVFGSLVWLPRLMQAKLEDQGFTQATAVTVGSLFASLFQIGAVLSILGGWLGDRWQRRDPRGRALLSMIGILAGIPFYVVLFFMPLRLDLPPDAGAGAGAGAILRGIVTEPTIGLTLLVSLFALALTSINSPNWFALIGDVNPPEHRGTIYGIGNLVNGAGRGIGNGLVGVAFGALAGSFPPPLNYAIGLAAFQAFFLPTGWCYWRAAKSSPQDVAAVRALLRERAAAATTAAPHAEVGAEPSGDLRV
jgi:MFS transporter, Spinster family, sphingosine-1-phosphate transporter